MFSQLNDEIGVINTQLTNRFVTLINNSTALQYSAGDILVADVSEYKYIAITYLYGLTGLEYTKLLLVPSTRNTRLDIVSDYNGTVFTEIQVTPGNKSLAVQLNGSTAGVYIKTVVGIK